MADLTDNFDWTLQRVHDAIKNRKDGNDILEVPTYQRNLVWSDEQKKLFIDSVKKGFPIGTLLFYKNSERNNCYSLIDGLQRSSTIVDFIENPTKYFNEEDIKLEIIESICSIIGVNNENETESEIKKIIKEEMFSQSINSKNVTNTTTRRILNKYQINDMEKFYLVSEKLAPCFENYQTMFNDVSQKKMHIIVFKGQSSDLPTIFERINSQGTQLTKYQIFAASWAVGNRLYDIKNEEIIKNVSLKYDDYVDKGYKVENYERESFLSGKQLNLFEYVMGFGRFLSVSFPGLFEQPNGIQDISHIGFEIINYTYGKTAKVLKNLNETLREVDLNKLEKCIMDVTRFIYKILKPFIEFKGNSRTGKPILFHGQQQIVSIIASTTREKYNMDTLEEKNDWGEKEILLQKYIPQYYVYDILTKYWFEGSDGKIAQIVSERNENRYLKELDRNLLDAALSSTFASFNARKEKKQVPAPKNIEKLFLAVVYQNKFTVADQLSHSSFDIEHLWTKEKLKKLISDHEWEGLPISSIGNLCYLPEFDNRSKGEKTIYEDTKYTNNLINKRIDLSTIEDKYTFTSKEQFDIIINTPENITYDSFKNAYESFLNQHFSKMKIEFFTNLKYNME